MESFKDTRLLSRLFLLELLSAVEPRVVNWDLVTKGESDEEKNLNATYITSVARKIGCSIFLLPEDIMEVNQKMILTLTASLMYSSLQQPMYELESSPAASSRGVSPEPSVEETPSPASVAISDASLSPPANVSLSSACATTPGSSSSPLLPINGASSPAASASPEASPGTSISGEVDSLLVAEISNMTIDDTASDNTVSGPVDDAAPDTATSVPVPENEETQSLSEQ